MTASAPVRDRWGVIGGYPLLGAANQMLWLTFTPITTPTAHHYGVSVNASAGWLRSFRFLCRARRSSRVVTRSLVPARHWPSARFSPRSAVRAPRTGTTRSRGHWPASC